jgi:hypothetical protein
MFGRRTFGKQQHSFADLKKMMRPTPDADGVTRVFSKELWDDPKIGSFLRAASGNHRHCCLDEAAHRQRIELPQRISRAVP